jgi:hypothetical protein
VDDEMTRAARRQLAAAGRTPASLARADGSFCRARRIKGIEHAEIAASKADEVAGDQDQSPGLAVAPKRPWMAAEWLPTFKHLPSSAIWGQQSRNVASE